MDRNDKLSRENERGVTLKAGIYTVTLSSSPKVKEYEVSISINSRIILGGYRRIGKLTQCGG
jgi:hypothetical protein